MKQLKEQLDLSKQEQSKTNEEDYKRWTDKVQDLNNQIARLGISFLGKNLCSQLLP